MQPLGNDDDSFKGGDALNLLLQSNGLDFKGNAINIIVLFFLLRVFNGVFLMQHSV